MSIPSITASDALSLIHDDRAILIDVREPDEFKAEHIAYAMSIPLSNFENDFKTLQIPSDKIIIFQCLKGGRSMSACEKVENLTSSSHHIINLAGGIEAWKNADLPTIQSVE